MSDGPTRTIGGGAPPTEVRGLGLELVTQGSVDVTPLPVGSLIVGRGDDVDLQILGDGVSRRHVKLVHRSGSEVQIIDLGSHNGTHVNDVKVEVAAIRPGDEFRIGDVTLRLVPYHPTDDAPTAGGDGLVEQLSRRELEVAQLVAKGLTNAQVGAQLHISPRTVGRHLGNIYERLGIHSRAALATAIGQAAAGASSRSGRS